VAGAERFRDLIRKADAARNAVPTDDSGPRPLHQPVRASA
jgi:hypothetical protein